VTKIIINGSKGRMGQAIAACAARIPKIEVVGQVDQGDDLGAIIAKCDVVIDFSFHNVTSAVAELSVKHRKALVIGTTGHSDSEKSQISNLKSQITDLNRHWPCIAV
jgi:4-hydroxy-tetrahydrodipicolinate reductase